MPKSYEIEVPAIVVTQTTGVALTVSDTIRGHKWTMVCDGGARPLWITRDGAPCLKLPALLRPMHEFARRFLNVDRPRV